MGQKAQPCGNVRLRLSCNAEILAGAGKSEAEGSTLLVSVAALTDAGFYRLPSAAPGKAN